MSYQCQSTMTALTETTRLLLADNIRHRLVTSGLTVADVENVSSLPHWLGTTIERGTMTDKLQRSMRFLCTELYQKHEAVFEDMLQTLRITPNTLQVDLQSIMANVFADQVPL